MKKGRGVFLGSMLLEIHIKLSHFSLENKVDEQ